MVNELEKVVIEFRSDTFTKPTKEMIEAMSAAEVGDSQYDEDPTLNSKLFSILNLNTKQNKTLIYKYKLELEKNVAELFGKDAAIYVPSGTMANLIAVMTHCYERGSEVIVGDKSHFNLWEQGRDQLE